MTLHPSRAYLWSVCPASAALEGRFPAEETESARWGNVAHNIAAARLRGEVDPFTPEDAEMEEAISTYVDYVNREVRPVAADSYWVERSLTPQVHPELIPTVRPDVIAVDTESSTVHIVDFKTGHKFVDPVGNGQGVCAASVFWEHRNFVFHIVQPRGFHPGGPIRKWAFGRSELDERTALLREAAIAAASPDAPFVPTTGCGVCSGRAHCSALRTAAINHAEILPGDPASMTPEETGRELDFLEAAKAVLDARAEGLRVSVETVIRNGGRVPGWTLRSTPGALKWTLPDDVVIDVLGDAVQKPAAPITPTQARKLGLEVEFLTARQPGALKLEKTKWQ